MRQLRILPFFAEETRPLSSSTLRCLRNVGSPIENGAASSFTDATPRSASDSITGESEGLPLAQRITLASPQTFSQWEAGYSISTSATACPKSDGASNMLKYLCDIDPTRPMTAADRAALPFSSLDTTTTPGTAYLTLTYRQNLLINGVTVNVQTSSDLQTWFTVPKNQLAINKVLGADVTTGDPGMKVGVKVTGSKQFIRLNITIP